MRTIRSVTGYDAYSKRYPENTSGLVTRLPIIPKVGHALDNNGNYWYSKPADKYITLADGTVERWVGVQIDTLYSHYGTIKIFTRVKSA